MIDKLDLTEKAKSVWPTHLLVLKTIAKQEEIIDVVNILMTKVKELENERPKTNS